MLTKYNPFNNPNDLAIPGYPTCPACWSETEIPIHRGPVAPGDGTGVVQKNKQKQ